MVHEQEIRKRWEKMKYGYRGKEFCNTRNRRLQCRYRDKNIGWTTDDFHYWNEDTAVKESADRIQSAIDESGYVFPKNG